MRKLSLNPPERTAVLQALWAEQSSSDLGPCGKTFSHMIIHNHALLLLLLLFHVCHGVTFSGGFSHQYWCVCDYLGLPYREEVQWVCTEDCCPFKYFFCLSDCLLIE